MSEYIIYGGGGSDGYSIKDTSSGLSDKYKTEVLTLYQKRDICQLTDEPDSGDNAFVRYAPLTDDKYLLTFCFKNCRAVENDSRNTFASVNWILESTEAEALFMNFTELLARYFTESRGKLVTSGYRIDESRTIDYYPQTKLSKVEKEALICSVFFAASGTKHNGKLPSQIYMCGSSLDDYSAMVSYLADFMPQKMAKKLSFFMGASFFSETYGTTLVFMNKASLEKAIANGSKNGSPNCPKHILINGKLDMVFDKDTLKQAQAFCNLTPSSLVALQPLFASSDDLYAWLECALRIDSYNESDALLADFINALGTELCVKNIECDNFSDQTLKRIISLKKELSSKVIKAASAALEKNRHGKNTDYSDSYKVGAFEMNKDQRKEPETSAPVSFKKDNSNIADNKGGSNLSYIGILFFSFFSVMLVAISSFFLGQLWVIASNNLPFEYFSGAHILLWVGVLLIAFIVYIIFIQTCNAIKLSKSKSHKNSQH